MTEKVMKTYRVEVKARLASCPRCGGWTHVEPDLISGAWRVCVNCGWQEEISVDKGAEVSHSR
ncbi:MAG: hypothetical protein M1370_10450 [Bacteroidetes bacterium]|nr:hypothetical protein [Bacteroidota bacterium]MCL5026805.1 hypothetical protein [Chloroflexota bacterium]